jgi:peptidoglycan/LPS O-acetylase OafA/YrhL
MKKLITDTFSRKISSERSYIEESEGVRFVATVLVIVGHILVYMRVKTEAPYHASVPEKMFIALFTKEGLGLEIFFVLSGFLLVLPFISHYCNQTKKPSLAEYYLRRIVRLELPYFLALTVSSLLLVFFIQKFSFDYLLPRYIASLFYSNQIIYRVHPEPLPLAWSLETEVIFYLLVPLLSMLFLKNKIFRRLLLAAGIITIPFILYTYQIRPRFEILRWVQYFLGGTLLADVYVNERHKFTGTKWREVITVVSFVSLIIISTFLTSGANRMVSHMIKPFIIALFIFSVIHYKSFRPFFTNLYVKAIGIMCYSIYLWHYMIISFLGKYTLHLRVGNNLLPNLLIQAFIILPVILTVSFLMFKYVEKPCMYSPLPKKWAASFKNYFGKK